jgi:hypothetical protein
VVDSTRLVYILRDLTTIRVALLLGIAIGLHKDGKKNIRRVSYMEAEAF